MPGAIGFGRKFFELHLAKLVIALEFPQITKKKKKKKSSGYPLSHTSLFQSIHTRPMHIPYFAREKDTFSRFACPTNPAFVVTTRSTITTGASAPGTSPP